MQVEVDNRGQVEGISDNPPTMIMAGPVPSVIFEPLPSDSRTQWNTHHEYTMQIESGGEEKKEPERPFAAGGFGPDGFRERFGPSGFGGGSFGPRPESAHRTSAQGATRPQQTTPSRSRSSPSWKTRITKSPADRAIW